MENKVFNIDELEFKINSTFLVVSKRNSGKSILVKHILKNLCENHEVSNIILFSETASYETEYDFIDKKYIIDGIDENKIEKIIKYQQKNTKNNKKIKLIFIFDDVNVNDKSRQLIKLFTQSRHFHVTVIVSA